MPLILQFIANMIFLGVACICAGVALNALMEIVKQTLERG